jgi:hypothetical protein
MVERPVKITFAEMRDSGVRGILVYCTDYRRSHSTALMADHWPGNVRLSDIEPLFACSVCGKRGADNSRHCIEDDYGFRERHEPHYIPDMLQHVTVALQLFNDVEVWLSLKIQRPCVGLRNHPPEEG